MDTSQLAGLPSPFYRVAVKVLIFDESAKLLVTQNAEGNWEIPGGGWEHDESLELSVQREMDEELGAKVHDISDIEFVLRGVSDRGWHVIRLVVRAVLDKGTNLQPGDDQVAYRYVTREEFMQLNFCGADEVFQTAADKIWTD
jgi:ADP-ribose pyrophosphatase YjhB (NUDIX family)